MELKTLGFQLYMCNLLPPLPASITIPFVVRVAFQFGLCENSCEFDNLVTVNSKVHKKCTVKHIFQIILIPSKAKKSLNILLLDNQTLNILRIYVSEHKIPGIGVCSRILGHTLLCDVRRTHVPQLIFCVYNLHQSPEVTKI